MHVAVKVFCKAAMAGNSGLLGQAVAEIQLHEELQREVLRDGVPRLLAVNEDETHLHLIFEYGGKRLLREVVTLSDGERGEVGDAIVAAATPLLARLHGKGLSYNDFKPEQLLLTRRPDGAGFRVNVCDLGAATALGSPPTACTPIYAPPEAGPDMLNYIARLPHPKLADSFGVKYDSWALGATLVVALFGSNPWETPEARAIADDYDAYDSAVVARIVAAPRAYRDHAQFSALPSDVRGFLDAALDPNPATRATCLELCFSDYAQRLGVHDWATTPEAAPLLRGKAERAAAALAAAEAERASKVRAFFDAATAELEAADQRGAALRGRVAALEEEARAGAAREIKAVVEGCGEPRAPSRASSRRLSPNGASKLACVDVAALFAAECGSSSCTGASVATHVAGAMKPCAVSSGAAVRSTGDVSCSDARGDACAALDAASSCEADAAAAIAVVTLTSTSSGASSKQLSLKSGGAKSPCAVRGGRDMRTPAERVQGAAHKLRKEAGRAAAALKGAFCMRAPAVY
ncbi:hypothetical protein MNEG_13230 [Monoraphidium neglectum]|uniref:Protein kinase domain-containing protein n=1 Tax=Monoraphidium neglectum TaxID=145388 RepID=A0A0D2KFS6_9CHLO|nr:hypothetical protein MNEG_13230 [Monoraphidium neglectum]KIY94733.1 hypothetical protein MNEG_13230 [Monoraphidium neglectum]|eukprot:XP_013893753.1 hypothetical protein MNEG_13230 [Monoraphidium neglectum]